MGPAELAAVGLFQAVAQGTAMIGNLPSAMKMRRLHHPDRTTTCRIAFISLAVGGRAFVINISARSRSNDQGETNVVSYARKEKRLSRYIFLRCIQTIVGGTINAQLLMSCRANT